MWYKFLRFSWGWLISTEQASTYCGSSVAKLTSGQPVGGDSGLSQVCVQVLLAQLPNIESTCRGFCFFSFFFFFFMLHCIFDSNVNRFVSINCSSFFSLPSVYLYLLYCILLPVHRRNASGHFFLKKETCEKKNSTPSSSRSDCEAKIHTSTDFSFVESTNHTSVPLAGLNSSGALAG